MKWGLCMHGETGYVFHVLHSDTNASDYILVTYCIDIYVDIDITKKTINNKNKIYHSYEYILINK